jgi:hypothetical protein
VTEADWHAGAEPDAMILSLPANRFQRELRLFAVGCVRRVWNLLPDPCRAAVEVSERFANGMASEEELRRAVASADEATRRAFPGHAAPNAYAYAVSAAIDASSIWPRTTAIVLAVTSCAASALGCAVAETVEESRYDAVFEAARRAELVAQAGLLRSIISWPVG